MSKAYIEVLSRSVEPQEPSVFFSLLKEHIPKTWPKRFSRYDDKRYPMSPEFFSQLAEYWRTGYVYWDMKESNDGGCAFLGTEHEDTEIFHRFDTDLARDAEAIRFLTELSRALWVDYGLLHLRDDDPKKKPPSDGMLGSFLGKQVWRALPGVPWAACYGRPYVELFGRDALLSLPIHKSEEIGPGLIYCQLTERLADCVENPALIDARREEVYRHLGRDAFYDPQDPKRQGRVPPFEKPRVAHVW